MTPTPHWHIELALELLEKIYSKLGQDIDWTNETAKIREFSPKVFDLIFTQQIAQWYLTNSPNSVAIALVSSLQTILEKTGNEPVNISISPSHLYYLLLVTNFKILEEGVIAKDTYEKLNSEFGKSYSFLNFHFGKQQALFDDTFDDAYEFHFLELINWGNFQSQKNWFWFINYFKKHLEENPQALSAIQTWTDNFVEKLVLRDDRLESFFNTCEQLCDDLRFFINFIFDLGEEKFAALQKTLEFTQYKIKEIRFGETSLFKYERDAADAQEIRKEELEAVIKTLTLKSLQIASLLNMSSDVFKNANLIDVYRQFQQRLKALSNFTKFTYPKDLIVNARKHACLKSIKKEVQEFPKEFIEGVVLATPKHEVQEELHGSVSLSTASLHGSLTLSTASLPPPSLTVEEEDYQLVKADSGSPDEGYKTDSPKKSTVPNPVSVITHLFYNWGRLSSKSDSSPSSSSSRGSTEDISDKHALVLSTCSIADEGVDPVVTPLNCSRESDDAVIKPVPLVPLRMGRI